MISSRCSPCFSIFHCPHLSSAFPYAYIIIRQTLSTWWQRWLSAPPGLTSPAEREWHLFPSNSNKVPCLAHFVTICVTCPSLNLILCLFGLSWVIYPPLELGGVWGRGLSSATTLLIELRGVGVSQRKIRILLLKEGE